MITENCAVLTENIIALLFGINCTEINQSQSNNIIMYTNILVRRSWLFERGGGLIDDLLYEKGNVLVMIY